MKFVDAIIGITLFGLLSYSFVNVLSACQKLNKQYLNCLKIKNEDFFIGETFVKTCRGTCFDDLTQWQSICRDMFELDYIGWSNADEFMDVSMRDSNEDLFYGVWKKEGNVREVYCRKIR